METALLANPLTRRWNNIASGTFLRSLVSVTSSHPSPILHAPYGCFDWTWWIKPRMFWLSDMFWLDVAHEPTNALWSDSIRRTKMRHGDARSVSQKWNAFRTYVGLVVLVHPSFLAMRCYRRSLCGVTGVRMANWKRSWQPFSAVETIEFSIFLLLVVVVVVVKSSRDITFLHKKAAWFSVNEMPTPTLQSFHALVWSS